MALFTNTLGIMFVHVASVQDPDVTSIGDWLVKQRIAQMLSAVTVAVHRGGGIVAKTLPDSVLATFPAADAALKAAIAMQVDSVLDVGADTETTLTSSRARIRLGVAMHFGQMVVAAGNISGDVVEETAVLAESAQPGKVLATQSFASALRSAENKQKIASLTPKTMDLGRGPVDVYALPWRPADWKAAPGDETAPTLTPAPAVKSAPAPAPAPAAKSAPTPASDEAPAPAPAPAPAAKSAPTPASDEAPAPAPAPAPAAKSAPTPASDEAPAPAPAPAPAAKSAPTPASDEAPAPAPAPATPPAPAPIAHLQVFYAGSRIDLHEANPTLTLGRSSDNMLTIKSPHVSRRHARIEFDRDGFYLVNHSPNGSCVRRDGQNEVLCSDRQRLEGHGYIGLGPDIARCGGHLIEFTLM